MLEPDLFQGIDLLKKTFHLIGMNKKNITSLFEELIKLEQEKQILDREIALKKQEFKKHLKEKHGLEEDLFLSVLNNEMDADTSSHEQKETPRRRIPNATIREGTIKDYVVKVLSDSKEGMLALDLLDEINRRFDTNYIRSSLSPQLSRLKQAGVIDINNSLWQLVPKKL